MRYLSDIKSEIELYMVSLVLKCFEMFPARLAHFTDLRQPRRVRKSLKTRKTCIEKIYTSTE
jgi:hypothetical protein